jgi:pimeloyl-ACP methyl ester carboxylesterase
VTRPTAVLVHGAFADASGFGGVLRELTRAGYDAVAPPNPLRGLACDASAIGAVAAAIDGPVVLIGHAYGGAVISQASAGLVNVAGLVYLAAFGLAVGESCASVQEPFPPSLLATAVYLTSYDAPGASTGPDLYLGQERFRPALCADVPADLADVMYATQRPLSLAAHTEKATAAGWRDRPSWFLVCEDDQAISPDAERFMAERMKAVTESVSGSHAAFIAQPVRVAGFIMKALASCPAGRSASVAAVHEVRELHSRSDAEFAENRAQVRTDGVGRHAELGGR